MVKSEIRPRYKEKNSSPENGSAANQVAQRAVEEVFQVPLDKVLSNPV